MDPAEKQSDLQYILVFHQDNKRSALCSLLISLEHKASLFNIEGL